LELHHQTPRKRAPRLDVVETRAARSLIRSYQAELSQWNLLFAHLRAECESGRKLDASARASVMLRRIRQVQSHMEKELCETDERIVSTSIVRDIRKAVARLAGEFSKLSEE